MGANNSVPADYSAAAYAVLVLEITLTTAAVVGRTISRKMCKAPLSTDDTLTYLSYTANLGLLASGLLLTAFGALDLSHLATQAEKERHIIKAAYGSLAVLYVAAITFIKLSILFLYRRTFTMFEAWFRWAWWILLHLVLLWTITCVILLALEGVGGMPSNGFSRLGISITGIVNAFSDILLMLMPAIMISRMKLQKKQKIALISIFAIGGVASSVSLVRATIFFVNRASQLNEAYSNYLDIILTATESSAGLMCACLPLTKPLVIRTTKWVQRLRGLSTEHHGWTTVSASQKSANPAKDRSIMRVDEYQIQLVSLSESQQSRLEQNAGVGETPWQALGQCETMTQCVSPKLQKARLSITPQWEVQKNRGQRRA